MSHLYLYYTGMLDVKVRVWVGEKMCVLQIAVTVVREGHLCYGFTESCPEHFVM